jgi:hypothetical protein
MKIDARYIIILANVLLIAGVLLSFVIHWHETWHAPKVIMPTLTPPPNVNALNALDQLNVSLPYLTEKPLFWPSRRPLPAEPQGQSLGSLEGAQLLGTFSDGATHGAIIRVDKKTKKVIRLVLGESYQGQVLMEVDAFSVEFSDPAGLKHTLTLDYAKQPNAQPGLPTAEPMQTNPNP